MVCFIFLNFECNTPGNKREPGPTASTTAHFPSAILKTTSQCSMHAGWSADDITRLVHDCTCPGKIFLLFYDLKYICNKHILKKNV